MSAARLDGYVRSRFDALEGRFRAEVDDDDYRLRGVQRALGTLQGRRVLDLGSGKGRFARRLVERGALVIALDASLAMLRCARGLPRVQASATRLPLPSGWFDAVVAIEMLEHAADPGAVLREAARVLRPEGTLVLIDKSRHALDARRPWLPAAAVKRLDETRGRWMYPPGSPFRERWFRPARLARELRESFADVRIERLLSPDESSRAIFRLCPAARLMTVWIARRPGARPA